MFVGKVNILVQTDRTIPPHAIMKRRKKKDANGNIIPSSAKDAREECGGVGTDAVATPNIVSCLLMTHYCSSCCTTMLNHSYIVRHKYQFW